MNDRRIFIMEISLSARITARGMPFVQSQIYERQGLSRGSPSNRETEVIPRALGGLAQAGAVGSRAEATENAGAKVEPERCQFLILFATTADEEAGRGLAAAAVEYVECHHRYEQRAALDREVVKLGDGEAYRALQRNLAERLDGRNPVPAANRLLEEGRDLRILPGMRGNHPRLDQDIASRRRPGIGDHYVELEHHFIVGNDGPVRLEIDCQIRLEARRDNPAVIRRCGLGHQ